MLSRRLMSVLCLGACVVAAAIARADETPFAADHAYIKEHYTKYEYEIPMRDGVKLFAAVYVPKDASQRYPILLQRTPYGLRPYGASNYPSSPRGPMKYYAKERFIFAYEDVRGRNASEGEFVHVRPHQEGKGPKDIDESTDTYDTIDFLVKHVPHNNGKVGLLGISYPGFYSAAGAIDAHPALKCVSPQAPVTDWFLGDDFRHNGALYLAHAFRFLSFFGQELSKPTRQSPRPFDYETPDGYEFYLNLGPLDEVQETHFEKPITFWDELNEHGTYDDFWKARTILPHLKNLRPAMMTVGGWFDAEDLYGPLNVYRAAEEQSPGAYNMLVMGPWAHGDWHRGDAERLGAVAFHQKTGEFYRTKIELPFLKHFLKGGPDPKLPEAYVFETGTHQWRRFNSWPPKGTTEKSLYLHPDGKLSFEPPQASSPGYDEYVSDPNKPVPFIPNIAIGMTREHMLDDQRFASTRTDVLTYVTEPLEEDVTIAGPITPSLFVSTSGTDADWVVKLIDVYSGDFPNPDPNPAGLAMGGYQQLVRGEAMRGKFRNSFEKPEAFTPGERTKVEYVMPGACHTFRRGHRIMVQVQSSWFPLVDRNPQRFMDIYHAKAKDFQKATQRVYHTPDAASQVKIQVLESGG
ncbi:MAG: CocE/NonD family hydrolase [Planctomycetota bacterium]|nr:MAG: CocE/NonD family hydrolase [Planctomycetota bacterium]